MFSFLICQSINPYFRRTVLWLFLIIGTLSACQQGSLNVLPEEANQGVVGKIAWVRDMAYTYQDGGEKARTYKWDAVFRGQWVETERRSAIAISFADGTQIFLGESAKLLIDDYVYNPQTTQGTADYKFLVGSMRFISGNMIPSRVGIETPTAKIGFTGSDALIFVTPAGETIVNVFKGTFTVRDLGGAERTATSASENRVARATISENENISVSPKGVLSDKETGSKYPSSNEVSIKGDEGSAGTKETRDISNTEERDDTTRDWNIDIKTLDPSAPGIDVVSPLHAGSHRGVKSGGGGTKKASPPSTPSDPGSPGHGISHDHPAPSDPGQGGGHDGHGDHGDSEGDHDGGGNGH